MDVADAIVTAAVVTAQAIAKTTRRVLRTAKAIITATQRHVPKWMAGVLAIALLIPGPQDELVVLLVIAGFAIFKPAMRQDIATATRNAWTQD